MQDLIERLEKATGSDSDLDGDIAVCMGLYARRPVVCVPPAYTSSLDAALTLVPAGYKWEVRSSRGHDMATAAAIVWHQNMMGGPAFRGNTPVLALCIAALRAEAVWQSCGATDTETV